MDFVTENLTTNLGTVQEFSMKRTKFPWAEVLITPVAIFCMALMIYHGFELEMNARFLIIFLPVTIIVTYMKLQKIITKESVLVIPSQGLQLMHTTAVGKQSGIYFIPISNIRSVIINETIKRQHVISYLALTLRSPDKNGKSLVPVFEKTLPKLEVLKKVYNNIYRTLEQFSMN